jgi:murein DD-endopeptidase MepM/ murein hydrolase activator NlpD
MHKYFYKILLSLLKVLVYLKRLVFWVGSIIGDILSLIFKIFRNTIGFRLYKIKFQLQKYTRRLRIPKDTQIVELIGKRSTLQIALFVVVLAIMMPHSKLYTRDTTKIPGRDTLLYQIIGPGEQDFNLEEVTINFATIAPKETDTWKQGSVQALPSQTINSQIAVQQQDLSSITLGGTAVTKPNIIAGANLPTSSGDTGRTTIINYTVQPGDTIGAIAEKYSISVATILWSNNLSSYSLIRPGDNLKILPISGLIHKVKSGDTLSKLAKIYDTDIDKIIEANVLKEDGSDIIVGEELVIAGGTKPRPVYSYTPTTRKYNQLSSVAAPPPSPSAPAGSGYLWPTNVRRITQYYGWRHTGLDIGGPTGSPLYASKAGTITRSQCGWNGGYGCYVIIDHGGGIQTLYGHASRLYVSTGERVVQGQTIAAMGNTGRSTGPHIHFEVRINGRRMNPLTYIK